MRLALYSSLILAAGLLFGKAALGQDVHATVDRHRIGFDESLAFAVTLDDADGVVDTGPIKDFKVLSHGTSTSIRIVNGQSSRQTAFNYTLIPLKTGRLTIPSLPVRAGGSTLTTKAISVQVTQTPLSDASRGDVFATSDVSKSDPYTGEQIMFHLRLHHAVRISDPSVRELPDFEGFSAKQLEARDGYRKIIDGREYIVRELVYILVPLSPGTRTIGPALISLDVYRRQKGSARGAGSRFFDDFFLNPGRRETLLVRTAPIAVNVSPLPPDEPGAPPFSGLIGRFAIEAGFEKRQVQAGDAATLSVTLTGSGNIMDAAPPNIPIPEGLKAYADTPEDSIRVTDRGYEGKKTFRTALVGVTPGTYPIAPISVRYFDAAAGRYATLRADIDTLTVLPTEETDSFEVASGSKTTPSAEPLKQTVEFTGRDILPVTEDLDALKNRVRISPLLFIALLAAPAAFCMVAWGFQRLRRQNNDPGTLMAQRTRQALKAAQTAPEDRFLSLLSRALIAAILSRAGAKGESLTYREAEEILVSTGLEPNRAHEISRLLDRIDSGRYGGASMGADERQSLLAETRLSVAEVLKL
jgi:hypothetical protein